MRTLATVCLVALLSVAFPARGAVEGAERAAGRALMQRYADAIVGVELVVTLKVKSGDRELPPREQRAEVNGTVIAANGLTVTSLAEVDPQTAFEAARVAQPGRQVELLGVDFKEVKLRLADGTEVPARFVLKDADLDLAFMAPENATAEAGPRTFTHVDLAAATEGDVMDEFYFVSRASKALQRVPLVQQSVVRGLVEKPRRLYLMTYLALGTPMFDAQGRVLGLGLQHFANGRRSGLVVLPSADVAEIARQVVYTKPEPVAAPATELAPGGAEPVADPGAAPQPE